MKKKVLIQGVVHGVGFRAYVERNAKELNLKGYVKNVEEGVEAIFEGEEDKVNEMIKRCHIAPPAPRVDSVKIEDTDEEVSDFERR
jgi:acylphosphatase